MFSLVQTKIAWIILLWNLSGSIALLSKKNHSQSQWGFTANSSKLQNSSYIPIPPLKQTLAQSVMFEKKEFAVLKIDIYWGDHFRLFLGSSNFHLIFFLETQRFFLEIFQNTNNNENNAYATRKKTLSHRPHILAQMSLTTKKCNMATLEHSF